MPFVTNNLNAQNSTTPDPHWFKGNLRPLALYSVDSDSINDILNTYKAAGYHFLTLPQEDFRRVSITNLPLILFPFTQLINDPDDNYNIELNAVNIDKLDSVPNDELYVDLFESYLNIADRQEKDNLCYTNAEIFKSEDFYHIIAASNVNFIELYNGVAEESIVNQGFGNIEKVWDMINTVRCEEGRNLLYGLVNEKRYHGAGGGGHVMVQAQSDQPHDLITAINGGNFYASTGVELEEVSYELRALDGRLFPSVFVKVKAEPGVTYNIEVMIVSQDATQFSSVNGEVNAWFIVDNHTEGEQGTLFSRIKVTSSRIISYEGGAPQI